MRKINRLALLVVAVLMGLVQQVRAQEVHVYSAQKEHLIRPLLEQFTEQSGIKVRLITGDAAGLVTRIEREGEHSPADLLLTADIGNIYQAMSKKLLQPIDSEVLNSNIPANLRDDQGHWYGITKRARLFFVRRDQMDQAPETYLDVAGEAWKGGILVRSSQNVYNQSLMAFMIHHYGEAGALDWARGVVRNMARSPKGSDRDQLRALAATEGSIAIANSYYYGMLTSDDPSLRDEQVAEKVAVVFPNQQTTGVHVNIRGGGVVRHAQHPQEAQALLEFLSDKQAQTYFTQHNHEYPVHPEVQPSPLLQGWSGEPIRYDDTTLEAIGALRAKAIMLMDQAGWK